MKMKKNLLWMFAAILFCGVMTTSCGSDDDDSTVNDDGSDQPGGMIETNIYIDGKKTARAITPYVAKELDWEDK